MGIEPTEPVVNTRSNGFEDRGHHQVCKHFRKELIRASDARRNSRVIVPQSGG